MTCTDFPHPAPTTARPDDSILFAALELSKTRRAASAKSWLVATSAPGEEKVSKRTVSAGDGRALLDLLAGLREKTDRQAGQGCRDLASPDRTRCQICDRDQAAIAGQDSHLYPEPIDKPAHPRSGSASAIRRFWWGRPAILPGNPSGA